MTVENGHDGMVWVTAEVVDHHFASAAELGGDACGHLPQKLQSFALREAPSSLHIRTIYPLYHIIVFMEINRFSKTFFAFQTFCLTSAVLML